MAELFPRLLRLYSLWFGLFVVGFLLLASRDSESHVSTNGFSIGGNVFFAMNCSKQWTFASGPKPLHPLGADRVFSRRFMPSNTGEYYNMVIEGFRRTGWKKFAVRTSSILFVFIGMWSCVVIWRYRCRKQFEIQHFGGLSSERDTG